MRIKEAAEENNIQEQEGHHQGTGSARVSKPRTQKATHPKRKWKQKKDVRAKRAKVGAEWGGGPTMRRLHSK